MSTAAVIQPKATWRGVVRKRTFEVHSFHDMMAVFQKLADERYTGPVTVDVAQGGIRGICAEDRAQLGPST